MKPANSVPGMPEFSSPMSFGTSSPVSSSNPGNHVFGGGFHSSPLQGQGRRRMEEGRNALGNRNGIGRIARIDKGGFVIRIRLAQQIVKSEKRLARTQRGLERKGFRSVYCKTPNCCLFLHRSASQNTARLFALYSVLPNRPDPTSPMKSVPGLAFS